MYVKNSRMRQSIKRRDLGLQPVSRLLRFGWHPVLCLLFAACSQALPTIGDVSSAPAAPERPWRVPAGAVAAEPSPSVLAASIDSARAGGALGLAQVVDIALRSNPQTQLSWAQARSGAATYGAAISTYFPTLDASANVQRSQTTSQLGASQRTTITPTANLNYLLLDFGGRSGTIAAARAAAVSLDLTHNATIQNVALQAEASYFAYQAANALLDADRLTVAEADTNLVSARQRNQGGVATIADVLQAQTVLSQAQLDLETAEGNARIARGGLAVAMGLPANARFDLTPVTDSLAISSSSASVDTLIDRALALRPDLAALRAQIQQAQAEVSVARSAELPSLTLGATFGKTYSDVNTFQGLNYGITLGVAIPIFNLARPYNVTAAEAEVDAARARASLLRIQVGQQVYTSYYSLLTASQRSRTADVLLASAIQSDEVARARYRAGVGTIVDLITAEAALSSARAQQSQARWSWAIALAQLSHDVGLIGLRGETSIPLGGDSNGVRR
jgi:outer membrane protein